MRYREALKLSKGSLIRIKSTNELRTVITSIDEGKDVAVVAEKLSEDSLNIWFVYTNREITVP
jgi:hypothetical protein